MRFRLALAVFALAALQAGAVVAQAPKLPTRGDALDEWCKTVNLPSSIAICSEPDLRAIAVDRQHAFDEVRSRLTPDQQKALLADQNGWVKTYPQACGLSPDAAPSLPLATAIRDCMAQAGLGRIAYLHAYGGAPAIANAAPVAAPTARAGEQPQSPLIWSEITSLSDYAKHIKHRWIKYYENDAPGFVSNSSYVDLASIIRTGDTLSVLKMEDYTPPLNGGADPLGSILTLMRFACGGSPRFMPLATILFHGNMGSGTQRVFKGSVAADVPKVSSEGWVEESEIFNGIKAHDMACNYGGASAAANATPAAPEAPLPSPIAAKVPPGAAPHSATDQPPMLLDPPPTVARGQCPPEADCRPPDQQGTCLDFGGGPPIKNCNGNKLAFCLTLRADVSIDDCTRATRKEYDTHIAEEKRIEAQQALDPARIAAQAEFDITPRGTVLKSRQVLMGDRAKFSCLASNENKIDVLEICSIDPTWAGALGAMDHIASIRPAVSPSPFLSFGGGHPAWATPWVNAHCQPMVAGYRCEWKGLELTYQ